MYAAVARRPHTPRPNVADSERSVLSRQRFFEQRRGLNSPGEWPMSEFFLHKEHSRFNSTKWVAAVFTCRVAKNPTGARKKTL